MRIWRQFADVADGVGELEGRLRLKTGDSIEGVGWAYFL